MNPYLCIIFCILFPVIGMTQNITEVTDLNDDLSETSGLLYVDGRIITHNDSQGLNNLYEINKNTGNISRTVTIKGTTNVDWEDLCQDGEYIYIGDFGNNKGSRTDLKIYKVSKAEYLSSVEVAAEVIDFNYSDQEGLISAPQNTNFDAEAFISFADKLYIFTKNWLDKRTNVYEVSKKPGVYSIERVDQINAMGLVTGATINETADKIILSGYSGIQAFAIELRGFSGNKFSNGIIDKYNFDLPLNESFQIESIAYVNGYDYYMSSEQNALGGATLYTLSSTTLGLSDFDLKKSSVYPNPANEILNIKNIDFLEKVEIYNFLGQSLHEDDSGANEIDITQLSKGIYVIKLYALNGTQSLKFLKN